MNLKNLLFCAAFAALCAAHGAGAEFIGAGPENGRKCAIVAHEFANPKAVAKAEWKVSGLGVVVPSVNGRAAAEEILMPGFTVQKKRREEISLDVTRLLRCGAGETNRLEALATPSWWCDAISGRRGGTWPAFRGELALSHTDGSVTRICTGPDWLVSTETPFAETGIWEGEVFDAGAKPLSWRPAVVSHEFSGEVSPRIGPGVVLRRDLEMPGGEFSLAPGEKAIIDFGQNAAALPLLRLDEAPAGTVVSVRLGEMLNDGIPGHGCDGPAGSLYLANMRGIRAGFDYTVGATPAAYIPSATFFGYRYAQISATGPVKGSISSIPVSSVSRAMERGKIETGHPGVNRLLANAYWGMLSNYLSIPTDCPQRNERLGWTGDTQIFARTGSYFADTSTFMERWMQCLRDSQYPDGVVPTVVPPAPFGSGGPVAGWSDAVVIVPWTMWKYLGDETIVRDNWCAMMRFVDHVFSTGYAIKSGGVLADWLSFEKLSMNQRTAWNRRAISEDQRHYQLFLNACHLLQDVRMMREMAGRLPGLDGADRLESIENATRERILATWFRPDGTLIELFDGMQTPALFALKLGLGDRDKIASSLVEAIHANGDRLSTGFLGTPLLCEVLSEIGETGLAYTLLLQRRFPSWLYSIDQGATTSWERWDGYTKERGFGDVGMNSFNHYAYGAVAAWLFEHAAGIKPGPDGGWKNFTLAPEPDKRLGRLKATLATPLGTIESEWKYGDDGLCRWRYSIPPGATAEIIPPAGAAAWED